MNCFHVLLARSSAGLMPASAKTFATVVRPISIASPVSPAALLHPACLSKLNTPLNLCENLRDHFLDTTGTDGVQGGRDGPAAGVAEHDHQARAELRGRELDRPDHRRGHDVAGDADDEEIAEALVEQDLDRCARIRAAQHDGEGTLGLHRQLGGEGPGRVQRTPFAEALVALDEALGGHSRRQGIGIPSVWHRSLALRV
jgi:hypothetical protein